MDKIEEVLEWSRLLGRHEQCQNRQQQRQETGTCAMSSGWSSTARPSASAAHFVSSGGLSAALSAPAGAPALPACAMHAP